jgi:hypothetical protein
LGRIQQQLHLILRTPQQYWAMRCGTLGWLRIVSALEQVKGESWTGFAHRHGDWGRDAALWFGRRAGRLPLGELGKLAGGLDYALVSEAIARFGRRLETDAILRGDVANHPRPIVQMTRPDPNASMLQCFNASNASTAARSAQYGRARESKFLSS